MIKPLTSKPGLTEQVYRAILDEICLGNLAPGLHLVQEQLAAGLGVSRQPVQQALALLKNDGLVLELGRRGLFVAPLDPASIESHYQIRAALDGLAAKLAAGRAAQSPQFASARRSEGQARIAAGLAAVAAGDVAAMIRSDVDFHAFVYACSGNPLIATTAELHWRFLRRVMGEVLRVAEPPAEVWRQHGEILDAIMRGDADEAEARAIEHVEVAAERLRMVLGERSRHGDSLAERQRETHNPRNRKEAPGGNHEGGSDARSDRQRTGPPQTGGDRRARPGARTFVREVE